MPEFKFCPKCGGGLIKKNTDLLICNVCNFHFYQNPRPCNAAILENQKGEILFIKRKWPPKRGWYDLPGGFVDLDETIEQSIKRELKEELGVDNLDLKFFGYSEPDRYLYSGVNYHTIGFIFIGKINDKNVRALDDVGEIIFLPKDKIPYGKVAFKSLIKVLKDYTKGAKSFSQKTLT